LAERLLPGATMGATLLAGKCRLGGGDLNGRGFVGVLCECEYWNVCEFLF